MSAKQIALIEKWRGIIQGPKVIFPTSWHRQMYLKELRHAA